MQRNVGAPNRIGPADLHAAQQVGINCLHRMSYVRRRPRRHPCQLHMAHQPLHPLAVCDISQPSHKNPRIAFACAITLPRSVAYIPVSIGAHYTGR
ncbi:hypothetical protein MAMT_01240 [Methylacidimicrobium tartarophylax]|uniref:Uncharacterized protein n=1 Tax=Methylacidimicrobium tartarophylax TaxID=1041768 RepID=A0A5E6MBD7_9BACT|nr:hypothetical protein MAMT_01240 [Methylacidimicrobium tartarophylax]